MFKKYIVIVATVWCCMSVFTDIHYVINALSWVINTNGNMGMNSFVMNVMYTIGHVFLTGLCFMMLKAIRNDLRS